MFCHGWTSFSEKYHVATRKGFTCSLCIVFENKLRKSCFIKSERYSCKIIEKESNHFINHLEEEAEKLESVSDEVIQVDLFLDLTKQLQLTGKKYLLPREIDEQCDAIINSSYELLYEKDKKFQAFA